MTFMADKDDCRDSGQVDWIQAFEDGGEGSALLRFLRKERIGWAHAALERPLLHLDHLAFCDFIANYSQVRVVETEMWEAGAPTWDHNPEAAWGGLRTELRSHSTTEDSDLWDENYWARFLGSPDDGELQRPMTVLGNEVYVGFCEELADHLARVATLGDDSPAAYTVDHLWECASDLSSEEQTDLEQEVDGEQGGDATSTEASGQAGLGGLNENERRVESLLRQAGRVLTIEEMTSAFPNLPPSQANSWVRNSLRKLVRLGIVSKSARGRYCLASGAAGTPDLPLPDNWKPLLMRLSPGAPHPDSVIDLPITSGDVAEALNTIDRVLGGALETAMRLRWSQGLGLQEVAVHKGWSRDHARHVEQECMRVLGSTCPNLTAKMDEWFRQEVRPWARLVRVSQERAGAFELVLAWTSLRMGRTIEAFPMAQWPALRLVGLREDIDIARRQALPVLRREWLLSLPLLGRRLKCGPQEALAYYAALVGHAHLSMDGRIGANEWSDESRLMVVARELFVEGHDRWHGSEMAKALAVVFPVSFKGGSERRVAELCSLLDDKHRLEAAGGPGVWQLAGGLAEGRSKVVGTVGG